MTALAMPPEFHEERRKGMFATDTWRIHPRGENKPLEVYQEKKALREPWSGNRYTEAGHALEEAIGRLCENDTGMVLRRCPTRWHRKHKWLGCHLDFIVSEGTRQRARRAVDAKYTARGKPGDGEWGEPGSDKVPDRILCQLHHQIVAGQLEVAHAFVFFGSTAERVLYTVEPDKDWRDMILEIDSDFWFEHVQKDIPPEPGETEYKIAFPKDNGQTLQMDDLILPVSEQAEEFRLLAKEYKEKYTSLAETLKREAEDFRYLADEDGNVRWDYRTITPRVPDVDKTMARIRAEAPQEYARIMETWGVIPEPYRALYPKAVKEKKDGKD